MDSLGTALNQYSVFKTDVADENLSRPLSIFQNRSVPGIPAALPGAGVIVIETFSHDIAAVMSYRDFETSS